MRAIALGLQLTKLTGLQLLQLTKLTGIQLMSLGKLRVHLTKLTDLQLLQLTKLRVHLTKLTDLQGVTGRPPREATTRSISRYVSDGGVRSRDASQSSMRTALRGRRGASPLPDRERKLHTPRGCAQIWGRSRTLTMPEPLSHTRAETSPSSAMLKVCEGRFEGFGQR